MDDAGGERRCLIALSLVPGLGPVRIARLIARFGSADAALRAPRESLVEVEGVGEETAAAIIAARGAGRVAAALRRAGECGARVVTWSDGEYPARLRGIPAAPPVVYLRGAWRGDAPAASPAQMTLQPAVAIVGTRSATPYGLGVAERLAAVLAARGVVVVSGLARGIDAAAHRAAVAGGGCTVGVLGCGVDVAYPPEHRSLMEAMMMRGALVAEAPMGAQPEPGFFPARNRLISGLADAVVVVEGDSRSGAMITAGRAREQGRPLFAVPGSVYAAGSRGPHRLLAGGARALTVPEDVLAVLAAVERVSVPGPAGRDGDELDGGTAEERRVLAAVDAGDARSVDRVAALAGVDPGAAAAALVALEVRGEVRRMNGGLYVRAVPSSAGRTAGDKTGGTECRDHWSW
jgi:DNA processing protein